MRGGGGAGTRRPGAAERGRGTAAGPRHRAGPLVLPVLVPRRPRARGPAGPEGPPLTPLSPTLLPRGRSEQHVDIHRRGCLRSRAPEGRVGQVQWLPLVPSPGECGWAGQAYRRRASGPCPPILGLGPPRTARTAVPGDSMQSWGLRVLGRQGIRELGCGGLSWALGVGGLRV